MLVDRKEFTAALKIVARGADPKSSMPALGCVELQANGRMLTLSATDLHICIKHKIPCQGEISAAVNAKELVAAVKGKAKAGEQLGITAEGQEVVISIGGMAARLSAFPISDLPAPAWVREPDHWEPVVSWDSQQFVGDLGWVLLAVSEDEGRPHLNALCLEPGRAVGTDGHRMHYLEIEGPERETLVPRQAAAVMLSTVGKGKGEEVWLERGEYLEDTDKGPVVREALRLYFGSTAIYTRPVETQFPPYRRCIPTAAERKETVLEVAGESLRQAFEAATLPKGDCVRVRVNGKVTLTADDYAGQSRQVVLPARSSHEGEDLLVGFNPTYLVDAARDGAVRVCLGETGLEFARIEMGNALAVISPMRI